MGANKKEKPQKGSMTVAEAGSKGGKKTSETHGREFYEEIGHKGGSKVKELIEAGKRAKEEEEKKKSQRQPRS
jgi:general stress protein YciG